MQCVLKVYEKFPVLYCIIIPIWLVVLKQIHLYSMHVQRLFSITAHSFVYNDVIR